MIVNENRLREFFSNAIIDCESCPLYKPLNDYTLCDKYNELTSPNTLPADCSKGILAWLQEFDITEALEEGAHIVNDQIVFPPISLPDNFKLNVPCDDGESCTSSCPWYNNCPFEDD